MHSRHAQALTLVSLVAASGCAREKPAARDRSVESAEAALNSRADSLASLDPVRELRDALARGDRRFVAVCGYSCEPPGLPDSVMIRLQDADIRRVEGTTDVLHGTGQNRLNAEARKYAERYNALLFRAPRGRP